MKYALWILMILAYYSLCTYIFNQVEPWTGIGLGLAGILFLIYKIEKMITDQMKKEKE